MRNNITRGVSVRPCKTKKKKIKTFTIQLPYAYNII